MPDQGCSEVLRHPCALTLCDEPLASAVEHGPMQLRVEAAQVGIPLHHFIDSEIREQGAVKLMRTRIRLMAQHKSMHSIIDATQREQRHGSA